MKRVRERQIGVPRAGKREKRVGLVRVTESERRGRTERGGENAKEAAAAAVHAAAVAPWWRPPAGGRETFQPFFPTFAGGTTVSAISVGEAALPRGGVRHS